MEHDLIIEMQGAGSATRMTFSDLVDEYLQAKRNDLRETTLDKKRRIFASTITPLLGKIRVDKLSPLQIQKWKDSIPSRLNVSTKQNYFKELRAVLRFAVLRGYIDRSPIERVENFRDTEFQSKPLSRVRYYTAEEFAAFIDVARQEAETKNTAMAWGIYVFFNVAFWSGLRKGEIHALRWSDLDDSLKTIHVRRSLAQKLKGEDRETAPKTRSSVRDVGCPSCLVQILDEHQRRLKVFGLYRKNFRVCGVETDALRDTTIEKANTRFAEAAGLKHITIHEFRHSHASILANAGINIQEVARRLGHADIKETWQTYSHLYPSEADRAIDALDYAYK
jgi:integrase